MSSQADALLAVADAFDLAADAMREAARAVRRTGVADRTPAGFVSLAEAAEALNLSRTSVHRAIRRGDIASTKVGRRRLVPRSAIDAMADQNDGASDGR